jgi:hypothetical protein
MAAPIPFDAPVTTATLPFKSFMNFSCRAVRLSHEEQRADFQRLIRAATLARLAQLDFGQA